MPTIEYMDLSIILSIIPPYFSLTHISFSFLHSVSFCFFFFSVFSSLCVSFLLCHWVSIEFFTFSFPSSSYRFFSLLFPVCSLYSFFPFSLLFVRPPLHPPLHFLFLPSLITLCPSLPVFFPFHPPPPPPTLFPSPLLSLPDTHSIPSPIPFPSPFPLHSLASATSYLKWTCDPQLSRIFARGGKAKYEPLPPMPTSCITDTTRPSDLELFYDHLPPTSPPNDPHITPHTFLTRISLMVPIIRGS